MVKYEFAVKTRDGQKVSRLMIMGADQPDAERKLRQMYRDCAILQCNVHHGGQKQHQPVAIEGLLALVVKEY
jgi:hypothetical protein